MADRDVLINSLLTFSNAQALYKDLPNEVRKVCRQAADALQCGPLESVYRAALEEIAKGEGAFSRDPLEHAVNCIESMKSIAWEALNKPSATNEITKEKS